MCPGDLDAGGFGEVAQAAGGRVPVHPGAPGIKENRPADSGGYRPVDSPAHCWRQQDQDDLAAFAAHAQHPVVVLFTQVGDVRPGRLEDPQAEKAEHRHQREVAWILRLASRGE